MSRSIFLLFRREKAQRVPPLSGTSSLFSLCSRTQHLECGNTVKIQDKNARSESLFSRLDVSAPGRSAGKIDV